MRTDVDERLAGSERRLEVSRLGWLSHPPQWASSGVMTWSLRGSSNGPTTVSTSTTGSNVGLSKRSSTTNPVSSGDRASCSRLDFAGRDRAIRRGLYSQHPRQVNHDLNLSACE